MLLVGSFASPKEKFKGLITSGEIAGEKIHILKPQTYMNNSGTSVQLAMQFYKVAPADVVVMYDELDLLPGKVRVKIGGGSGGHNGIKSIDAHVGSEYKRVRIGIGHPGEKHLVHNYVLGDFTKDESVLMEKMNEAIAEAFPILLNGEDASFMSKVSLTLNPPAPKPPRKITEESSGV
ncbi:MAG: aminoacyl-tRNA hydrolase [Proteobacteria bacterium]|nr:aminoacyl-tRNA hydrolase [Pseudomonadota bacterium]